MIPGMPLCFVLHRKSHEGTKKTLFWRWATQWRVPQWRPVKPFPCAVFMLPRLTAMMTMWMRMDLCVRCVYPFRGLLRPLGSTVLHSSALIGFGSCVISVDLSVTLGKLLSGSAGVIYRHTHIGRPMFNMSVYTRIHQSQTSPINKATSCILYLIYCRALQSPSARVHMRTTRGANRSSCWDRPTTAFPIPLQRCWLVEWVTGQLGHRLCGVFKQSLQDTVLIIPSPLA